MSTKIWYDKYKIGYDNVDNQWMRALPLGNGRVAAMVFGNPDCEVIEVNEESMWSGKQVEEKYEQKELFRKLAEHRNELLQNN